LLPLSMAKYGSFSAYFSQFAIISGGVI